MKANPQTLLAASALWLGTLIGAYQLGHRQDVIRPAEETTRPATSGGNTRMASYSRNGANADGRNSQRSADKPLTVKQLFAQLKSTMRPGSMMNPIATMRAMALLD